MKKLTTISLFIFGIILIAVFSAGLVFYQNNKDNQVSGVKTPNQNTVVKSTNSNINNTNTKSTTGTTSSISTSTTKSSVKSLTLNMAEISKHNNESDCWMLISGKVYNITNYFGRHPGGSAAMAATCGTDATNAYMTKDPYATSAGGYSAHSSRAISLLQNFYLGDFGQTINAN